MEKPLEDIGHRVCSYVFPQGEHSKNINTLSDILEFLAENHIGCNDILIALGGDITGVATAIYMRVIPVVQVPTTLLFAVDSSVGGKMAMDHKNEKIFAGAFLQPSMVICDVRIIEEEPDKIFNEVMAEVIKCNIIKKL